MARAFEVGDKVKIKIETDDNTLYRYGYIIGYDEKDEDKYTVSIAGYGDTYTKVEANISSLE